MTAAQRESATSRPDVVHSGHTQREAEMTRTNLNPAAEAKSDIATMSQSDPGAATSGRHLVALFDGDGLNTGQTAVLGHSPEAHERPDHVRVMDWIKETADHISAKLWTPQWFYDASNHTKIHSFVTLLRKIGWEPQPVSGGTDLGRLNLCLTIGQWGWGSGDTSLLVGAAHRDVWEQLKAARLQRPDPWVGVVGYEGLIPDARDNGLEIEFFDLEHDIKAHRTSLTREFRGPVPFDPSQFLTLRD